MAIEQESSEINTQIRDHVSNGGLKDWDFKKLAQDLYQTEEAFRFYFFSPKDSGHYEMPQTVLGFEKTNVNTLAYYLMVPDSVGLRYKINFNTVHLERPKWSIYETLLHEMTHLYVENNPDLAEPAKGHGKAFTAWCEEMGLHPRIGSGVHWKAADGQFEVLMQRWGVPRPIEADNVVPKDTPKIPWWDTVGVKPKGISTLVQYMSPDCIRKPLPCKVRSGRRDLNLGCLDCGGRLIPTINF